MKICAAVDEIYAIGVGKVQKQRPWHQPYNRTAVPRTMGHGQYREYRGPPRVK